MCTKTLTTSSKPSPVTNPYAKKYLAINTQSRVNPHLNYEPMAVNPHLNYASVAQRKKSSIKPKKCDESNSDPGRCNSIFTFTF